METSVVNKVNEQEVLFTQASRNLRLVHDFVWVDNTSPEKTLSTDKSKWNQIVLTNIAQYDKNVINNREHFPLTKYNEDGANVGAALDKQVIIEQQYWDQNETIIDKVKNKPKLLTSHRKTVQQYNIIDHSKRIPRHPSYYKFDDETTHILETLPFRMGPFMNMAGKGHNSIVIYADCLVGNRTYYPNGYAIKVYKLSSNVKKNCAILKHVQREVEHLQCITKSARYIFSTPLCVHRLRNVIMMNFIGDSQETAPSIDDLPSEVCGQLYQSIVTAMNDWYHRAEIVHGRLSTKNIVYFKDKPRYIGWSHSVRRQHPQALEKLMKDCHFVTRYFDSKGVAVKSRKELFKEITGLEEISSNVLEVPHKKDLWKHQHLTNPNRTSEDCMPRPSRNSRFK